MFEKLEDIRRKYEEVKARLGDPQFVQDHRAVRDARKTLTELEPVVAKIGEQRQLQKELEGARELVESLSPGEELYQMAAAERSALTERLGTVEQELKVLLLPKDPNDSRNVFLEIRAGTGGDEAGLFAAELFRMYTRYAERMRWKVEIVDRDDTGIGGIKTITALIEGEGAFSKLKYEGGVHRVQRVPATEARGRIHTSTATVAVLPEVEETDVALKPEDYRVDVYRAGGHGGQGVNTTDSAVRIVYKPGTPEEIVVTCQDNRSQLKNKAQALSVLRARLYAIDQEKRQRELGESRLAQVGTGERAEKIRTYNYPQDRVTDHRIGQNFSNLPGLLDGDLNRLIEALTVFDNAERIEMVGIAS